MAEQDHAALSPAPQGILFAQRVPTATCQAGNVENAALCFSWKEVWQLCKCSGMKESRVWLKRVWGNLSVKTLAYILEQVVLVFFPPLYTKY